MLPALEWLYSLQTIGVKLGLDNMRRLLDAIKSPATPPLTIHVAGTNGKGSVCAFVDQIARQHGLKTGLFTSPHLIRFQERMRVNGQMIPDKTLIRLLDQLRATVADWEPHPSFFEITLALAMTYFYEEEIQCLVLETGLGGRLDATNAVEPRHVSVITPIHYDHTHILGNTLESIAREKAGIFRTGVPVVSAPQDPEAEVALRQAAAAVKAPITFISAPYHGDIGLIGPHQRDNAAVAAAAIRATGFALSETLLQQGLRDTQWPGRFHRFGTRHTVDGAHNIASITALCDTWQAVHPGTNATIIFGCAQDKAPEDTLKLLAPIAKRFLFTPILSGRSAAPEALLSYVTREATVTDNLKNALSLAENYPEPILITGSLFLAGEAIAILTEDTLPSATEQ